jgi:hypothetical protein
MSHQYHTQENNKEKVVKVSLLLYHGHQPTTRKSSLRYFKVIAKGCMMTLKEVAHPAKATTLKVNQIKYYKLSILCLHLIN